jgi:hypothetical protein
VPGYLLVIAKAQAVLIGPELLRVMFDVGYFPPNTPPDKSVLDNTIISSVCRKPSVTPVSYPGTVDVSGGGAHGV